MRSNNKKYKMNYRIFNILPVGGGGAAAASPLYVETMTWGSIGSLALQTVILAIIGGTIGYLVKFALDKIFKKKKELPEYELNKSTGEVQKVDSKKLTDAFNGH